ncbi:MAG: tRNA (adenosine(37)-N6)-threonylcarbamoyltransferase complex ATPase subunit type 1 TsaE [Thermoanaerobaculia bacterium]|jgi:tRNA threonylcarbamoyladenosine biosynthesis protein TsaE
MQEWICETEEATEAAGHEIAALLPPDAVVHLVGDLGAGKTFLARAIAEARGASRNEVASPTFAILHEYPVPDGPPVIHIDGYRLSESQREWLEIGIDEILASPGLKLIEWPKASFSDYETGHWDVRIEMRDDGARLISLTRAE